MNIAPKEKQDAVLNMEPEGDFFDDIEELNAEHISVDAWGNEWDDSGDFMDMDFRLVED